MFWCAQTFYLLLILTINTHNHLSFYTIFIPGWSGYSSDFCETFIIVIIFLFYIYIYIYVCVLVFLSDRIRIYFFYIHIKISL